VNDRLLRVMIGALAVTGIAVAGYLTYARYSGTTITCSTGGCETVQNSDYATLLGIPVAALGLLVYALIFSTALSMTETARAAGAALALSAFLFSVYLLVLQLTVIGAVCDWCVINDTIATVLAPLAALRLRPQLALRPR
jgi:uncharacterized membrane protein